MSEPTTKDDRGNRKKQIPPKNQKQAHPQMQANLLPTDRKACTANKGGPATPIPLSTTQVT